MAKFFKPKHNIISTSNFILCNVGCDMMLISDAWNKNKLQITLPTRLQIATKKLDTRITLKRVRIRQKYSIAVVIRYRSMTNCTLPAL